MQASNNSPLPKGDLNNQELKPKGTIWKPLIAVSLLSVFSFTAGQYLPYVIVAVSGSGAIEAVPLAIFAVSAIVALVSVICLIRLAVSRAGDEKKIDLIKQDRGSQTEVRSSEYNDTNLKNKSNVPTPTPPPVTFGTQPNLSVSVPPPPPPVPNSNKTSLLKEANSPNQKDQRSALFEEIRKGIKLNDSKADKKSNNNGNSANEQFTNELNAKLKSSGGTDKEETQEAHATRIEKNLKERKPFTMNNTQDHPHDIASILQRRSAIEFSDSESGSEHSGSSSGSGWTEDEDKDKQREAEQKRKRLTKHKGKSTPPNPQPNSNKRRDSSDSGHGSGGEESRSTSPLLLKPADLHTRSKAPPAAQVNNVDPVNSEVQDPSTLPFKERMEKFGEKALRYKKENVVQGL
ncbi:MAG: hypothetical protein ACEY3F_03060 [Wolbachia sp.]